MYRSSILFICALSLAAPARSGAQTSSDRARERAAAQAEREREARERAAEKARDRAERDRDREAERQERLKASSLDTLVTFDARGTLSVSCPGGAVTVTASDRNEIRVKARTESGAIRFT